MNITNTGVAEDPRTSEQTAKDYKHEELSGAVQLNWVEKDQSIWKKYSIRNQDGSMSCMSQSCAKHFEQHTGVVQSAHPIYRSRANYPDQGMWMQDVGRIATTIGTTTEQADPSQNMNEDQMNADIKIDLTVKGKIYVAVTNFTDIDKIAEAIEISGSCMISVAGFVSEWNNEPTFNGKTSGMDLYHGICAVDYFLRNGVKCILIDDSWGHATTIGNGGQRVLSEEYVAKRLTSAMYILQFGPTEQKPTYSFTKYLAYGMQNNADVVALQKILAFEGLFPSTLETGNYYNITANAVLRWQIKHSVSDSASLISLSGRNVGPKTIAKLNELYSK